MKILVVDDDAMVVQAIKHSLNKEGYEVMIACNGMEALGIFENENIDLIITDIMMPELSGLNLITFFREFHSIKIPIIIVSALGKTNVIYPSLRMGANDFIIKPIDFALLSSSVKKHLNRC